MILNSPFISGSLTVTGNTILSGSITSLAGIAGTASYATNAEMLDGLDSTSFLTTSSFNAASSSFSTRVANTESTASAFIAASGSFSTRTTNAENYIASINAKTGSYATTGSNYFIGTQVVTGSVYITSDLIVQGSSSLQNITASAVSVGTNTIILNTATPILQFGGISVFDSGSTQGRSGSLLWNSLNDHWINVNPSGSDEGYNSAMVINGPKNTGSLGSEVGLTTNYIPVSQGEDHITDSIIFQSGSVNIGIGTSVPTAKLDVSGTGRFSGTSLSLGANTNGNTQLTINSTSSTAQRIAFQVAGVDQWLVGNGAASQNTNFEIYNAAGTVVLSLNKSTNAATFASSVTTGGQVAITSGFSTTTPAISIYNNTGANASNIAQIDFRVNNTFGGNERVASITALNPNASGNNGGALTFSVSANGTATTPSEGMRIIQNGNVGIGTNAPSYLLTVGAAGSTADSYIQIASTTTGTGNLFFGDATGAGTASYSGYIQYQHSADAMILGTSATERMRITSGGDVNIIGNSLNLHNGYFRLRNSAGNATYGLFIQTATWKGSGTDYSPSIAAEGGYGINFYTNGTTTERMVITSGGNVGIGTTSPNSILEISQASPILRIQASASDTLHGIEFRQGAGFDAFIKQLPQTGEFRISNGRSVGWGGFMTFYTDTVERMRITSTGNIQVANTLISTTGATGVPTIDTSVSFVSIANGATLDFPSMSGMIIVNNTNTGAVQVFICGGGTTASLGNVIGVTGTMTHSPNVGGYRFTNNTGSTGVFSFQVFKTRGTA